MSEKQLKAIAELERAFLKCRRAGISFIGMDASLLWYDGKQLAAAEKERGCLYDTQIACKQGQAVNTHKTYIDSGGW